MDLTRPVSLRNLVRRLHGALWLLAGLALLAGAAAVSAGLLPVRIWSPAPDPLPLPASLADAVRAVFDALGVTATYTLSFFGVCVARSVTVVGSVGGGDAGGTGGAERGEGKGGAGRARGAGSAAPLLAWTRLLGAAVVLLAITHAEHRLSDAGLARGFSPFGVEPGGYWGSYLAHHLTGNLPPISSLAVTGLALVIGLVLAFEPRPAATSPPPIRVPQPDTANAAPTASPLRAAAPASSAAPASATAPSPSAAPSAAALAERPTRTRRPRPARPRPSTSASRRPTVPGAAGLPPLDLLEETPPAPSGGNDRETEAQAQVLARVFRDFRIDARVLGASRGPNVTLYEVAPAPGVKVQRIVGLQDDIQLALRARSVRVVAPIPGRGTVGVEVPNPVQDVVRLRELIEAGDHRKKRLEIPLFLGRDANGQPLVGDLTRMPHLLIAGATGSGKSVCMNAIICSILATRSFREVKLLMIDPKMVELSLYRKIPHLLAPVVTDMRRAPSVLTWAVQKMEERYALLSSASVRQLTSYNALGRDALAERLGLSGADELDARKIPSHMAYIVCVIDEFADLMCAARKEVEMQIIRLAQKSRAVGIHLILATQRPTADVITGLIKSNLPCRMAFQVASKVDSRTILDANGADKLLGYGDMLYLPPGTSHLVRAQGTYVSDDEVKALCRYVREQGAPEYAGELTGAKPGSGEKKDELFDRAVRVVLETKRGSASLLQRRLGIGYSRASRLIDLMTDDQILGPYKGSKARELLVTLEEWNAAHPPAG